MFLLSHLCLTPQDGYTSLMMAAREGRTGCVLLLLEAGADIELLNEV